VGTGTGLRPETEALLQGSPEPRRTLVVLGDSIVYGWGVAYSQSYPALLEGLLNRGHGETRPWRVVNAGVPGDTVMMGCLRYALDVRPFRPQVVLIAFGLNDASLRRTQFDAHRERLWRAQHNLWPRLWAVLTRIMTKLLRRAWHKMRPATLREVQRQASPRVSPTMFTRGLRDLAQHARQDGATVYLLSLTPVWYQEVAEAQCAMYAHYDRLIAEVAQREGIALLRLNEAQDASFVPGSMFTEDGVHFTAEGQAWLAQKVYRLLQR
jgi:lysophospholipase L1-like esterase